MSQDREKPEKEVPELDPKHVEILQQGVVAWNKWREDNPEVIPHLFGANLSGAHLEGATLTEAHLEEANLDEAHFEGAFLNAAHLEGATLRGAHLWGATLRGAHFDNADLQRAELICTEGLVAGQLAGTNVTGTKLPEDIAEFESLKVADEAAKNSRSLFLIMLVGCVYSWLVLATTTDAALIMNTGSSPLPIIRVPVPIVGFFLVAPAFLLGAYVYFHLYLHGLWECLSKLPAIFPDGRPLDGRAYPWLLTSLVRPHFKLLSKKRPLFSKAKVGLSILLAWWVVPFTLYLFWAQALAAHVWYMTAWHLALFLASVAGGLALYRGALSTLRLEDPEPVRPASFVWQAMTAKRGAITVGALVQVSLTVLAMWGPGRLPRVTPLFHPYADLAGEQLSTRTEVRFAGDSTRVQPANLVGRNLRFADLNRAFLAEADLEFADLKGADLFGANLNGANLFDADLSDADLSGADLTGADLKRANVTGVMGVSADFWRRAVSSGAVCRDLDTDELTTFEAPTDGGAPDICVRR